MDRLRRQKPTLIVIAIGAGAVGLVSLAGGSGAAIGWTGAIVGVCAGVALGSVQARKPPDDLPSGKSHKP